MWLKIIEKICFDWIYCFSNGKKVSTAKCQIPQELYLTFRFVANYVSLDQHLCANFPYLYFFFTCRYHLFIRIKLSVCR